MQLGEISFKLSADTAGFNRDIDSAQSRIDAFTKTVDKAGAKQLNVEPKGRRELDTAVDSANSLAKGLDKAAAAAGGVKAPTAAVRGVGELHGAVDKATGGATRLSQAMGGIKTPAGATVEMQALGRAAEQASGSVQRLADATARTNSGGDLFGGLASGVKNMVPALTAAGVATAAFSKGLSRVTGIDSAQAKLRGLGHDAAGVAAVMDSALASVKGTAYGLDAAVTTAASAVAAGVKPGKELTTVLTTIADTAAISGDSMESMGAIFNSVLAKGKLQGDDLMQLRARGIPVLQFVAEQAGVTTEAVAEMASEGNISFQMFHDAMQQYLGGSAQEMGNTMVGAWNNMGAALGRLGAAVLDPALQQAPTVLAGVTDGLDIATKGVQVAVGAFNSIPAPIKAAAGALLAFKLAASTAVGQRWATNLTDTAAALRQVGTTAVTANQHLTGLARAKGTAATAAELMTRGMLPAGGVLAQMGTAFTTAAAGATRFSTAAGIAAAAGVGLKGAATGIFAAMGGGVGLAIMGATAALGAWISHTQKAKQEAEAAAAATQRWADTFAQTGGEMTRQVRETAAAEIQQSKLNDAVKAGLITYKEAVDAVTGYGNSYDAVKAKLEGTAEAETRLVMSGQVAREVLTEKGKMAQEAAAALGDMNQQMQDGAKHAADSAAAVAGTSTALGDLGSNLANSREGFARAGAALDMITGYAEDAKNAVKNFATELMMAEAMSPFASLESQLGAFAAKMAEFNENVGGAAWGGVQAMFDETTEAGRRAHAEMMGLADLTAGVMSQTMDSYLKNGSSVTEATAAAVAEGERMTAQIREQLTLQGYQSEQIDEMLAAYGAVPDTLLTQIQQQGAEQALEVLDLLKAKGIELKEVNGEITIDASQAEKAREILAEAGLSIDELSSKNGRLTIQADGSQAANTLGVIRDTLNGIPPTRGVSITADTQAAIVALNSLDADIHARASTGAAYTIMADDEDARAKLDDLKMKYEVIDGQLIINANTEEVISRLGVAANQVQALPDGRIIIDGKDVDAVINDLQLTASQVTRLPDGRVLISDNTAEVRERIKKLETPTHSTHTVTKNIIENVVSRVTRSVFGQAAQQYGGLVGYATGGHVGYRLPTTGAGTERTDGFLGVDNAGTPTAWVNRGEWVVNGRRSEQYNQTLAAINWGTPRDVIAALGNELPAFASGGQVAREVKSALGFMNGTRYIMGGWSPSGTDCSGAVSMAANIMAGLPPFDSRMSTMTIGAWLANKGWKSGRGGAGSAVVGWYDYGGGANGHTAMQLPDGTFIESGGNTGGGLTIGGKAGPLDGRGFTHFMHLPFTDKDDEGIYLGDGGVSTGMGSDVNAAGSSVGSVSIGSTRQFIGLDKKDGASGVGSTAGTGFSVGGLASARSSQTVGQMLGGKTAGEMRALAAQAGFTTQVDALLNSAAPSLEVMLKVNPETIDAFNKLGELRDDREEAAEAVTAAEEALAEARKQAANSTGDYGKKIEEARKELDKTRTAENADPEKIAKAQERLDNLLRDAPDNAAKAAKQVEKAERALEAARMKETRTVADLAEATDAYHRALREAPFKNLAAVLDTMSDAITQVGDAMLAGNTAFQERLKHEQEARAAQLAWVAVLKEATSAAKALADAERERSAAAFNGALAVSDAEWELAMFRADTADRTAQGFYTAAEAEAFHHEVLLGEAHLAAKVAHLKAQNALAEHENALAVSNAHLDLEHAQAMQLLNSERLRVANLKVAESQGILLGIQAGGMSALGHVVKGIGQIVAGVAKFLGGLAAMGAAIATFPVNPLGAVAAGAAAVPAMVTGVKDAVAGGAAIKANWEDAGTEWRGLSVADKAGVVFSGLAGVAGGVAGGVLAANGGSIDDVNAAITAGGALAALPFELRNAVGAAFADAAERRHALRMGDLDAREGVIKLAHEEKLLALMEQDLANGENLREIAESTRRQYELTKRADERTKQLNQRTTDANKGRPVLFQMGGSAWGGRIHDAALAGVGGFGGITAGDVLPSGGSMRIGDTGGVKVGGVSFMEPAVVGTAAAVATAEAALAQVENGLVLNQLVRQIIERMAPDRRGVTPKVGTQINGNVVVEYAADTFNLQDELARALIGG